MKVDFIEVRVIRDDNKNSIEITTINVEDIVKIFRPSDYNHNFIEVLIRGDKTSTTINSTYEEFKNRLLIFSNIASLGDND